MALGDELVVGVREADRTVAQLRRRTRRRPLRAWTGRPGRLRARSSGLFESRPPAKRGVERRLERGVVRRRRSGPTRTVVTSTPLLAELGPERLGEHPLERLARVVGAEVHRARVPPIELTITMPPRPRSHHRRPEEARRARPGCAVHGDAQELVVERARRGSGRAARPSRCTRTGRRRGRRSRLPTTSPMSRRRRGRRRPLASLRRGVLLTSAAVVAQELLAAGEHHHVQAASRRLVRVRPRRSPSTPRRPVPRGRTAPTKVRDDVLLTRECFTGAGLGCRVVSVDSTGRRSRCGAMDRKDRSRRCST